MWKSNIILRQTKSDGTGSRTAGPAAGAKNPIDIKTPLPIARSTDYISGTLRNVEKKVLTQKDPGIAKDSRMTGNPYSSKQTKQTKETSNFGGTSFGQALSSETAQGIYSGIGAAASLAGSFIDRDTTKNPTGYNTQQAIGDVLLKSGNPYAMAAGVAYKALSGIAEATGGNINTINKNQANELGISKWERFGNNVLGVIPGLGWAASTATTEGQKSHLIDEMSNAYADSVADIDRSQTLGGGKYLFGRDKIQSSILEANRRNQQLTNINLTNTMRKKSDYAQDLAQQNLNRYMGTNYMDMRMGKQGMKFPELDDIREMIKNRIIPEENIQKFADGGSILPQGKLHKELNHITEINSDLGDLTRKGIPVVTLNEGGEIEQIAEIERDEWTLSKEFTDQIEALWKDGSEEAMIECGKLVCEELLRNTQDSSNILGKEEEDE